MVSFLLSSKTSSVRDLNTSGESAYTHVLNCEWIYLRKIKANTTQHERNKCCIETSDGMWRCQNSCYFVESGAYSTYSYPCCMRNPYACMHHGPTTTGTSSPTFMAFWGRQWFCQLITSHKSKSRLARELCNFSPRFLHSLICPTVQENHFLFVRQAVDSHMLQPNDKAWRSEIAFQPHISK